MIRRLAVVVVLSFSVMTPVMAPASVAAQSDAPTTTEVAPDACRTIIGCPDAGPKPQQSGDRGGWAQLATLGMLTAAVTFIMMKIIRAARAAQVPSGE